MNILKIAQDKAKRNPLTTLLTITTIVSTAWSYLTENAELLSIPSKWIAIGTAVITIAMMVYNQLNNTNEA